MTTLRRRMLEDLQLRGLAPRTQQCYLDAVHQRAQQYRRAPDQLSEEELRQYFLCLLNQKQVAESTFRIHLYGIKFFYEMTLQRPWPVLALVRPRKSQKLPIVLSPQEARSLLAMVEHPKARMCLRMLYSCGLRLTEGTHLRVSDILLRAAAQALIKLAADPHYVGGLIGVLCVLHTWTRTLAYHPHVHCLVPAGGVSADRTQWQPARTSYLVPVHALSKLFRGLFRDLVCQERPDLTIPKSVWTKGWVVCCKPTVQGTERVLNYLGRYVHRIALTNHRLLSIADGQVGFRYQDSQDQRWRTMTLPAHEFIRRFLPHVLPQGFHKVRYYGLWSPVHRPLLHQLQLGLARHEPDPPPASPDRELHPIDSWCPALQAGQPCPHCAQGRLVVIRLLPRHDRGPPGATAPPSCCPHSLSSLQRVL